MIILPEFKLSKNVGIKNFKLEIAIDYDDEGNVEIIEFLNDFGWSENPSDLRLNNIFCDENDQDEWNNFFNDFMFLLESGKLPQRLSKLKNIDDSCYFNEEDINAVLIEED